MSCKMEADGDDNWFAFEGDSDSCDIVPVEMLVVSPTSDLQLVYEMR